MMMPLLRASLIAVAGLIAVLAPAPAARAAELLVVSQQNCPACMAWDMEVGSVYARTDAARLAPLRRVRIDQLAGAPYRFRAPIEGTPPFVLLDGTAEIGRITGYSDASAFWRALNGLLRQIRPDAEPVTQTVTARPDDGGATRQSPARSG